MLVGAVEALIEKRLPVLGSDVIERCHHVIEGVRLDRGCPGLPAVNLRQQSSSERWPDVSRRISVSASRQMSTPSL